MVRIGLPLGVEPVDVGVKQENPRVSECNMWTHVSEVHMSEVVHLLQTRAEVIGNDRPEGGIAAVVRGQAWPVGCVRQGEKRILIVGGDVGRRRVAWSERAERPCDGRRRIDGVTRTVSVRAVGAGLWVIEPRRE